MGNKYGQIISWKPAANAHAGRNFSWDIFALAGNPLVHSDLNAGSPNITPENFFNSPDGIAFDSLGCKPYSLIRSVNLQPISKVGGCVRPGNLSGSCACVIPSLGFFSGIVVRTLLLLGRAGLVDLLLRPVAPLARRPRRQRRRQGRGLQMALDLRVPARRGARGPAPYHNPSTSLPYASTFPIWQVPAG